jgi:hypothetical protein
MAQNRMTYRALLDQLQAADTDVLRRVLEHAMQGLIEAEAATQIGAGPHERASTTQRTRRCVRARASSARRPWSPWACVTPARRPAVAHQPAHGGTGRVARRRCENSTEFTPLRGT